jgi:hypothetical protein
MRFWTILATTTVLATFEGCGKDKAAETKTTGDSATGGDGTGGAQAPQKGPNVPAQGSDVRSSASRRHVAQAPPASPPAAGGNGASPPAAASPPTDGGNGASPPAAVA